MTGTYEEESKRMVQDFLDGKLQKDSSYEVSVDQKKIDGFKDQLLKYSDIDKKIKKFSESVKTSREVILGPTLNEELKTILDKHLSNIHETFKKDIESGKVWDPQGISDDFNVLQERLSSQLDNKISEYITKELRSDVTGRSGDEAFVDKESAVDAGLATFTLEKIPSIVLSIAPKLVGSNLRALAVEIRGASEKIIEMEGDIQKEVLKFREAIIDTMSILDSDQITKVSNLFKDVMNRAKMAVKDKSMFMPRLVKDVTRNIQTLDDIVKQAKKTSTEEVKESQQKVKESVANLVELSGIPEAQEGYEEEKNSPYYIQ